MPPKLQSNQTANKPEMGQFSEAVSKVEHFIEDPRILNLLKTMALFSDRNTASLSETNARLQKTQNELHLVSSKLKQERQKIVKKRQKMAEKLAKKGIVMTESSDSDDNIDFDVGINHDDVQSTSDSSRQSNLKLTPESRTMPTPSQIKKSTQPIRINPDNNATSPNTRTTPTNFEKTITPDKNSQQTNKPLRVRPILTSNPTTRTKRSVMSLPYSSDLQDDKYGITFQHKNIENKYKLLPLPPLHRHEQFVARFSKFLLDLYTFPHQNNMNDNDSSHDGAIVSHIDEISTHLIPKQLLLDFSWISAATYYFYNSYTFLSTLPIILTPVMQILDSEHTHTTLIKPSQYAQTSYWRLLKELYYLIIAITFLIANLHHNPQVDFTDSNIFINDGVEQFFERDKQDGSAQNSKNDGVAHHDGKNQGDNNRQKTNQNDKKKSKSDIRSDLVDVLELQHPYGLHSTELSTLLQSDIEFTPLYSYHPFQTYFLALRRLYEKHTKTIARKLSLDSKSTEQSTKISLNNDPTKKTNQNQFDEALTLPPLPTSIEFILSPANFLMFKKLMLSVILTIEQSNENWWYQFFTLLSTPMQSITYPNEENNTVKNDNDNEIIEEGEENGSNNDEKNPPTDQKSENELKNEKQIPKNVPLLSTPPPGHVTMTILLFWSFSTIPLTTFNADYNTKKLDSNSSLFSFSTTSQYLQSTPQSNLDHDMPTFIVSKHLSQLPLMTKIISDFGKPHKGSQTKSPIPTNIDQFGIVPSYNNITSLIIELALLQFSVFLNSLTYSYTFKAQIKQKKPLDRILLSNDITIMQRYQNDVHLHSGCMFEINKYETNFKNGSKYPLFQSPCYRFDLYNNTHVDHKKDITITKITPVPPIIPSDMPFSQLLSEQIAPNRSQGEPLHNQANSGKKVLMTLSEATNTIANSIPTMCQCCTYHLADRILTLPLMPLGTRQEDGNIKDKFQMDDHFFHNFCQKYDNNNQNDKSKPKIHPLFTHFSDPTDIDRFTLSYKQQILFKSLSLSSYPYYYPIESDRIDQNDPNTTSSMSDLNPPHSRPQFHPLSKTHNSLHFTPPGLDIDYLLNFFTLTQSLSQFLVSNISWHQSYMLLKHTLLPWYSNIIYTIARSGWNHTQSTISTQHFSLATLQFVLLSYGLLPSLYSYLGFERTITLPADDLICDNGQNDQKQTLSQIIPTTTNKSVLVSSLLTQIDIFLDTLIISLRSATQFTSVIQYSNQNITPDKPLTPLPPPLTTAQSQTPTSSLTNISLPTLQLESLYQLRRYLWVLNQTYTTTHLKPTTMVSNLDGNNIITGSLSSIFTSTVPNVSLDPTQSTPSLTLAKIFSQQYDVLQEIIQVDQILVKEFEAAGGKQQNNILQNNNDGDPNQYEMKFQSINHYLRSKGHHDDYLEYLRAEQEIEIEKKRQRGLAKAQRRKDTMIEQTKRANRIKTSEERYYEQQRQNTQQHAQNITEDKNTLPPTQQDRVIAKRR